MIYKTKCGKTIETTGITKLDFLEEVTQAPHVFWWVFWLLIFWPAIVVLIFMTYTNKVYLCKINDTDIVRMDKDMYNQIMTRINNTTASKIESVVKEGVSPYPENQKGVWTK